MNDIDDSSTSGRDKFVLKTNLHNADREKRHLPQLVILSSDTTRIVLDEAVPIGRNQLTDNA